LKVYPALDIRSTDHDNVYAALDDFAPTAIEECGENLRAFFSNPEMRVRALAALERRFDVSPVDVPDDDWARRSQQNLEPIVVGRILISPSDEYDRIEPIPDTVPETPIVIHIRPSMGFGTGHHATTRLCLAALQTIDLDGKVFLDLGTGSGILAIASVRLGARAIGIDGDEDAVQCAIENARANHLFREAPDGSDERQISFAVADLMHAPLPVAHAVAANLTGALLVRSADVILNAAAPGGFVILSGLMRHERDEVCRAFKGGMIVWERDEDEWVGLIVKKDG
jgi:ribosomal protein L11 methyltransferase